MSPKSCRGRQQGITHANQGGRGDTEEASASAKCFETLNRAYRGLPCGRVALSRLLQGKASESVNTAFLDILSSRKSRKYTLYSHDVSCKHDRAEQTVLLTLFFMNKTRWPGVALCIACKHNRAELNNTIRWPGVATCPRSTRSEHGVKSAGSKSRKRARSTGPPTTRSGGHNGDLEWGASVSSALTEASSFPTITLGKFHDASSRTAPLPLRMEGHDLGDKTDGGASEVRRAYSEYGAARVVRTFQTNV